MGTNVEYEIDDYIDAVMTETLLAYYSDKQYACSIKNENPNIFWMDNDFPENSEVIENYNKQLVIFNNTQYQRNRQAEYPSIADVTIALAEKMEGKDQMWDEITALRLDVKSRFPKP